MPRRAFIGTYTDGESEGLYACPTTEDGGLAGDRMESVPVPDDPSFLAVHPTDDSLYAVHETETGAASAFDVDDSGDVSHRNRVETGAGGPCFCQVHPSGDYLFVAHFTGGAVSVLPIDADGSLGEPTDVVHHEGSSVGERQSEPHPHSMVPGPNGRFAYVADLGADEVVVYEFDEQDGTLSEAAAVALQPGAGPRHLAFHPDEQFVFVCNELDSTVTSFEWVEQTGTLRSVDETPTCPPDVDVENYPGEICVHPNGKWVYASNRGHDSVVIFEVDAETGSLDPVAWADTRGEWPRHFTLDPAGMSLIVGNQHSDSVTTFSVDRETGRLTPTEDTLDVPDPACIRFHR